MASIKAVQATPQQVEKLFRRLLKPGEMQRLPKSKKDRDVFLALAASVLDSQRHYSETELNEHLTEWLSEFASPYGVDHVTVRRYLVDGFYIHRDAPGSWYKPNQTVINKVIEPEARSIQPKEILTEIITDKERRKRNAGT